MSAVPCAIAFPSAGAVIPGSAYLIPFSMCALILWHSHSWLCSWVWFFCHPDRSGRHFLAHRSLPALSVAEGVRRPRSAHFASRVLHRGGGTVARLQRNPQCSDQFNSCFTASPNRRGFPSPLHSHSSSESAAKISGASSATPPASLPPQTPPAETPPSPATNSSAPDFPSAAAPLPPPASPHTASLT